MKLDKAIFDEFLRITGKDISKYFDTALKFFESDYNTIVNYYSGSSKSISSVPFSNFELLEQENKNIFESFQIHSRQFNNLKWYLLIELIEEIDTRLKTLRNINKWARSSFTNVAYDPSIQVSYVLKQNQTIENVTKDFLRSENPNDEWADVALRNNLEEEDYTTGGGTELKLQLNRTNRGLKINSVVDVISGKSIYGKDIDKQLTLDSTTNDLRVLDYDKTIRQAVNILIHLKKNDNPDNPNAGLQSTLVVGGNRAMFNFPVISRQYDQTFAGDDTLKNFKIDNIRFEQDNLLMEYTVQTRLDEVFSDQSAV